MKKMNCLMLAFGFSLLVSQAMAANDPVASVAELKAKLNAKGPAKIEGTYKLGGKEIPGLKFGTMTVNTNENAIVDSVKAKVGGVCTIFIRTGDDYMRASTNVLDKAGKRCMGTLLKNPGPVHTAIQKGDTFTGEAEICENMYNTYYEPIKVDNKVVGIYLCGYKKE